MSQSYERELQRQHCKKLITTRVRFGLKTIFFSFEKRYSLLQRWRCTCVVVNSEIIRLDPDFFNPTNRNNCES
jgi:hypothetical protein